MQLIICCTFIFVYLVCIFCWCLVTRGRYVPAQPLSYILLPNCEFFCSWNRTLAIYLISSFVLVKLKERIILLVLFCAD